MVSQKIYDLAHRIVAASTDKGLSITTVESCTGGLIAGAITEIAGSSAMFMQGFVTYSNEAKTELVQVPVNVLQNHGAVSQEVARAMAQGALSAANANIAISVTGIAGPGGGTAEKPVGLVWFGRATKEGTQCWSQNFEDTGRTDIRQAAVLFALERIGEAVEEW